MDHSVHWGYSSAPSHQDTWIHSNRGLKRGYSESDGDELYSEESSKEQNSPGTTGVGNCHLLNRKKRRGVIEKKRRDRINNSLSELKRLVPSALEKQGSTKLEKAEILQLTVEHLKNLHSKGIDGSSCDQSRFALDYHIIGFRECAAEVARYLVTIEGMDIQDPLRLRLMSHLQYFVQQREISAKTTAATSQVAVAATWPVNAYHHHQTANMHHTPYQSYAIQANASTPYVQPILSHHSAATTTYSPVSNAHTMPVPSTIQSDINNVMLNPTDHHSTQQHTTHASHTTHHHTAETHQNTTSNSTDSNANQQLTQDQNQTAVYANQHNQQQQTTADPTYTELTTLVRNTTDNYYSPNSVQEYGPTTQNTNYTTNNSNKPYRPWGAEMAY